MQNEEYKISVTFGANLEKRYHNHHNQKLNPFSKTALESIQFYENQIKAEF